jgi:hypothetical protein
VCVLQPDCFTWLSKTKSPPLVKCSHKERESGKYQFGEREREREKTNEDEEGKEVIGNEANQVKMYRPGYHSGDTYDASHIWWVRVTNTARGNGCRWLHAMWTQIPVFRSHLMFPSSVCYHEYGSLFQWQLPIACWDCGFEFHRGYGCLLWVLCYQRSLATGRSPIQRSPTDCGVSLCVL